MDTSPIPAELLQGLNDLKIGDDLAQQLWLENTDAWDQLGENSGTVKLLVRLAKNNAALAKDNTELAKDKAILKKSLQESTWETGSLALPSLTQIPGTESSHHDTNHQDADFVLNRVSLDDDLRTLQDPEKLGVKKSMLWQLQREKSLTWRSEGDIMQFVLQALNDSARLLDLSQQITIQTERQFFSLRPDIWVLLADNNSPIGVVEVKRPIPNAVPSAMENKKHAGQLFDYMLLIRQLTGLESVFGVLSTYEEWKFCWLDHTDLHLLKYQPPQQSKTPVKQMESYDIQSNRELYCSETIKHNNPEAALWIVMFLRAMVQSSHKPQEKQVKNRKHFMQVTKDVLTWTTLNSKVKFPDSEERLGKMPHTQFTTFHLLRDLGGGLHGHVWEAFTVSLSGQVTFCVLKFGKKPHLDTENLLWKKIWGISTRIVELASRQTLVMPLLRQVSKDENNLKEEIVNAITKMAEAGYQHDDLAWRHVGYAMNHGIVLFDLGRVSEVSSKQEAISHMKMQLGIV
eukprot:c13088_g1_i3.p1 GENE.c13088_g1_i3~~c13088_g1_i3.p1  ORF type:complete len:515 (+),score=108.50 c13088_g1_i3:75-1619(+)